MSLILYFGKVICVSGILYGYYWFALRNKQFHLYNRFYLIVAVLTSIILPCINICLLDMNPTGTAKILHVISVGSWQDAVIITPHHPKLFSLLSWQNLLYAFYNIVSLFLILILAKNMRYVFQITKKYKWKKIDDIKLFYTREPRSPFSFFNYIFWNEELDISDKGGNIILRHEIYHVRKKHSIDILFLELFKCIFWFNPFFFLIKKEINVIHEFLADEYVTSGFDKYSYAELLVWHTINCKPLSITNPFFHHQIKRRISMIIQQKNKRYYYLSKVMILPVLLILFCAFSTRLKNAHSTSIGLSDLQKPSPAKSSGTITPGQPVSAYRLTRVIDTVPDNKIYSKVDVEADYPGGHQGWENYLYKAFHYPQEAINNEIQGTVVLQYIINKEGEVRNVKAISGPKRGGLREEAVRVIKNSGKWIPAIQNGRKVNAYKRQPIHFVLQNQ
ncbi:MAG TPA: M56 family metallopeptidase [Puia sp.]|nr:M56 family metallopeptidase [Puia sp.]